MAFTESLSYDRRLAGDDITGSRAHVKMLAEVGLISDGERAVISAALDRVLEELEASSFRFEPTDEDIHTAVERRVTEIAGPVGGKLHTGRSRNDQVALDLRLYLRREGKCVAQEIAALQRTLLAQAQWAGDAYMPGYTHLQRAQPVLLAHHLLAHGWALARDVERWKQLLERADVSPLGAGALAGSGLPLDPDMVARDLGFARRFDNSLDAVSDRDFVADALYAAALTQVHLSRIGEEIVLWSTQEFGFLSLDDAHSTGSSMLPQKKNPDIGELARAKAGRTLGHLTGFLATLKGLPLSYNRDLQEDKEHLFDALDTCILTLRALGGLLASSTFNIEAMQSGADSSSLGAVDLAEYLVMGGTPFREAHGIVGALIRQSIETDKALEELVLEDPRLGREAAELLAPGAGLARRNTPGGAGAKSVAVQLDAMGHLLNTQEAWLGR